MPQEMINYGLKVAR